jgi:Putative prokaryotic signal transducing protein
MSESSDSPARQRPDPNEKLVKVFDSERESESRIVKGLLDSAGIDADMTSVDAIQDMFPGVGGTVILVREEDAGEARRVIEEYRKSPTTDEETAEVDLSEDSSTAG